MANGTTPSSHHARRKSSTYSDAAPKAHQTFRLPNRAECVAWLEQILALHASLPSKALAHPEVPETRSVGLLNRRPGTRLQVLGGLEAKAARRRQCRAGLLLRGATVGADAVVDLQEERLFGYNRNGRRLTGIAVKAVDQEGQDELKSRRFAEQIDSFFLGNIVYIIAHAVAVHRVG